MRQKPTLTDSEATRRRHAEGTSSVVPEKPTRAELLIEQYKLLEDRRKYFGSQFMQTIGGVGAILSILIGLLGGKSDNATLLRFALLIGGIAFLLLAYLCYRLGRRQDDCERVMHEIERTLRSMGYEIIEEMPTGALIFGARKAIIVSLGALGVSLAIIGLIRR
jgi:hypothetical protein